MHSSSDITPLELTIEKLTHEAYGLARQQGKKYLVPFTLPGELVLADNPIPYKGHLLCQLSKILKPSANRILPECTHYTICGGCHLQHMTYADQLIFKQHLVEDLLGDICSEIHAIKPSPEAFRYRNRITLHQKQNKIGFFKSFSEDIVEIEDCKIAHTGLINQLKALRLSNPAKATREIELRDDNSSHFVQVNSLQNSTLADTVASHLKDAKKSNVLELYCGAGNLSFELAKYCKSLVGVDNNSDAIHEAKQKAKSLKLHKFEFHKSDVQDFVFDLVQNLKKFDAVICDPPRQGLLNSAQILTRLQNNLLIYVSCQPSSFKRDCLILIKSGYRIISITPIDMFPNTHHVELVARLQKDG